jgi:DNA-binding response OmpR family regulator
MNRSVLVVEDEILLALALLAALRAAGYRCIHASTVPQAMAMVSQEKFDAAILDVKLKGALVYPVADSLRAAAIPFLFTTAQPRSE